MADNFTGANVSGGNTFAADEIASVKHPRTKIQHGADGSATDVSTASPLPVDHTNALPAGTNNIGKVDVAAALPAGTNNIGDVDILTMPGAAAITDTIAAKLDVSALHSDITPLTPKFVSISAASNGNNTILAAVAAKRILVLAYKLVGAAAVTATFQDGAGGTGLSGAMTLATGVPNEASFCPVGHMRGSTATLLNLSLSGATQVSGHLTYVEVT